MKKHPGDPPACCDCDHYIARGHDGKCHSDNNSTFDAVTGRQPILASTARIRGRCGASGADFMPRPMPPWLDRHIGSILLGVVVIALIGYWLKQLGVFG